MKLLILIVLAFGVMFGVLPPKKAAKKIGMILLFPLLLMISWGIFSDILRQLPLFQQALLLIGGVILVLVLLLTQTRFGREVLASATGDFLYGTIRSIVTLPVRFLRFLLRRH